MTTEQFRELPLMLTRAQARNALGVTSRALSQLVRAGKLTAYRIPGSGDASRARYRKSEIAVMAGIRW